MVDKKGRGSEVHGQHAAPWVLRNGSGWSARVEGQHAAPWMRPPVPACEIDRIQEGGWSTRVQGKHVHTGFGHVRQRVRARATILHMLCCKEALRACILWGAVGQRRSLSGGSNSATRAWIMHNQASARARVRAQQLLPLALA